MLLAAAPLAGAASAAEEVEVNLEVVGRSDLGGTGPFDDVAVVGRTAFVASGGCPSGGTVAVVDLVDPRRPSVVATVSLPAGTVAADLDATATSSHTGALLAVARTPCGAGSPGVAFYDVTAPAGPRLLVERPGPGGSTVSIVQIDDGRVIAVRPAGPSAVVVDHLSSPSSAVTVGRWSAAGPAPSPGCPANPPQVAALYDRGQGALVVFPDGRVYDLDLSDPQHPSDGGGTAGGGRGRYGAVMPVGARTLAIVAGEGSDGACPGGDAPGLRVLELTRGAPPVDLEPVRFTTQAVPGRLVASGELAYVAWHGDGLRVVDMGQVRARVTAQFVPERSAVVGVALLDEHVLVVDRNAGLYVLERPDEGGARSSFWTDLVGFLPYLGMAGVLAAVFVVPRLAMGYAPGRSGVPSPVPERARRRRA